MDYGFREKRQVVECYNSDSLAMRLKSAEEDVEVIQEYIALVKEQASKLATTGFREEIHLGRRERFYPSGIEFDVSLHHIPDVPKPEDADYSWHLSYPVTDWKTFNGRGRHLAVKYAEDLAAEHNAPIVTEGYWGKHETVVPKEG